MKLPSSLSSLGSAWPFRGRGDAGPAPEREQDAETPSTSAAPPGPETLLLELAGQSREAATTGARGDGGGAADAAHGADGGGPAADAAVAGGPAADAATAGDAPTARSAGTTAATEILPAPEASAPAAIASSMTVDEYEELVGRNPLDREATRRALFGETVAGELVADSISAWFGDHKVLDRVSLTMPAGEVTALIGPSGCGKSTFLRILNRMHELVPSASLAGEVRLDGADIYDPSERITKARRQIGMVFQKPNPFPAMSIYDNVVSGLKLAGIRATRTQKDLLVEDSLRKASLWDEVKDRLEQPGGGLSGGQQQRLCIARSLAVSPRVLLMDEPCSALDPTSTRRVEETIAELRGQVTIVIVTHNMQQAQRVSSQCAFFLAAQNTPGVIVEYGDTTAMFTNPQDQRTSDYVNGRFG